jgi:hypothetical protein
MVSLTVTTSNDKNLNYISLLQTIKFKIEIVLIFWDKGDLVFKKDKRMLDSFKENNKWKEKLMD